MIETKSIIEMEHYELVMYKMLGHSLAEGVRIASDNGFVVRVTSNDSKLYAITDDFMPNRINVALVEGRINAIDLG